MIIKDRKHAGNIIRKIFSNVRQLAFIDTFDSVMFYETAQKTFEINLFDNEDREQGLSYQVEPKVWQWAMDQMAKYHKKGYFNSNFKKIVLGDQGFIYEKK